MKNNDKLLRQRVQTAWQLLRDAFHPKYHAAVRDAMLKAVAAEDEAFSAFVDIMSASGWDAHETVFSTVANGGLKAAQAKVNKEMKNHKKREKANKELDEAAEEPSDNEPVLHQCHYCGNMYHVSELSGAQMGLICYKCRHEMENRD